MFCTRCRDGVWLGVGLQRGEFIIGTIEVVVKARDFRMKSGGRWSKGGFDKFIRVPCEPCTDCR